MIMGLTKNKRMSKTINLNKEREKRDFTNFKKEINKLLKEEIVEKIEIEIYKNRLFNKTLFSGLEKYQIQKIEVMIDWERIEIDE